MINETYTTSTTPDVRTDISEFGVLFKPYNTLRTTHANEEWVRISAARIFLIAAATPLFSIAGPLQVCSMPALYHNSAGKQRGTYDPWLSGDDRYVVPGMRHALETRIIISVPVSAAPLPAPASVFYTERIIRSLTETFRTHNKARVFIGQPGGERHIVMCSEDGPDTAIGMSHAAMTITANAIVLAADPSATIEEPSFDALAEIFCHAAGQQYSTGNIRYRIYTKKDGFPETCRPGGCKMRKPVVIHADPSGALNDMSYPGPQTVPPLSTGAVCRICAVWKEDFPHVRIYMLAAAVCDQMNVMFVADEISNDYASASLIPGYLADDLGFDEDSQEIKSLLNRIYKDANIDREI